MEKRRAPDAERADGKGLRRVAPDEQIVAAVEQQADDFAARSRFGHDFALDAVRLAPARLAQQQQAQRQQHAGQSGIDKRAAPVAMLREPAADGEADGRAERNRHVEKRQRGVASRRGEEIGNPARAHRDEAGLAHADDHADGEELREALRQAAARRGEAPDHHAAEHEIFSREAVAEIAEDRRGDEIAEHEGRGGPARVAVAQAEVLLQRRQHRRHDVAVEVIEHVQPGENRQRAPGRGGVAQGERCGACGGKCAESAAASPRAHCADAMAAASRDKTFALHATPKLARIGCMGTLAQLKRKASP